MAQPPTPQTIAPTVLNATPTTNKPALTPQTLPPPLAAQLTTAGIDATQSLELLSTLQTKYESLHNALASWEAQAKKDTIIEAELEIIAQEPEVKFYYQMIKLILGQTLMAATVIASGKVATHNKTSTTAINGIFTLSELASASSFFLAVPIFSFMKVVTNTLDSTLTYREMQQHARWVDLEDIPAFASTLARRLALAQKQQIAAGMSRTDETMWMKIKNQCLVWIQGLKAGESFTPGEQRALLDAELLFEYMLSHTRPHDINLSGRINVLLQHLMGPKYVYNPPTVKTNTPTSSEQNPIPLQQNIVDTLQKEIATLKAARETDQKNNAEQEKQLAALQHNLHELQQQFRSTHVTEIEVGSGQIQVQKQLQENTLNSSAPTAVLSYVFSRVIAHDTAISDFGVHIATVSEQISSLEKAKENEISNTYDRKEDEDDHVLNSPCGFM